MTWHEYTRPGTARGGWTRASRAGRPRNAVATGAPSGRRREEPIELHVRDVVATHLVVDPAPAFVWAHLEPAPDHGTADITRAGWLTPYVAEIIADEALRAGPGARLELVVSREAEPEAIGDLQACFGWLARQGVGLTVRRQDDRGAAAFADLRAPLSPEAHTI